MPRLLHTGDLHLTEGPRFDDVRRVLDAIVASAREEHVDAVIVGGDLSGTTVPHLMSTAERDALGDFLVRCSATAPVVVVSGNHDDPADIAVFNRFQPEAHPIRVLTRATDTDLETKNGRVYVAALPYVTKGRILAKLSPSAGLEEQTATVSGYVGALLGAWEANLPACPRVLVSHLTVRGARVAGGEVLVGREVELDPHAIGSAWDYVACSHIHLHQVFGDRIVYAGSPSRSNFGETDPKGWVIADVARGLAPDVRRIESPARPFVTVRGEWVDGAWRYDKHPALADCEVRLSLTVRDEDLATADFATAEAAARQAGAVAVQLDPRAVVATRVRSTAVAEAKTVAEKLEATFATWGAARPDAETATRCLAKLEELTHATR